jgi:hypothetical protein
MGRLRVLNVEALEDLARSLAGIAPEAAKDKTVEDEDRTATEDETSANEWVQGGHREVAMWIGGSSAEIWGVLRRWHWRWRAERWRPCF